MDWTGGPTFFVLKITFVLSHSPVGLDMMHFSLHKPGRTILTALVLVKIMQS